MSRGRAMSDAVVARMKVLLLQDGWNMDRVAAKLKVSRASVYRYTGGRKALEAASQRKGKRRGR